MFSACLLSLPPEMLERVLSARIAQDSGRAVERRTALGVLLVTVLTTVVAAILQ